MIVSVVLKFWCTGKKNKKQVYPNTPSQNNRRITIGHWLFGNISEADVVKKKAVLLRTLGVGKNRFLSTSHGWEIAADRNNLGTSPTGFANGTQPNGCVRLGEDPAPAAVTFGRVCSGW
ncbi:uncharacterized protein LOC119766057 isoform X1 [Culex quinquefasciatus]|uniref:uncharacterized protein LOC119766057 isoform X1 n=1 Tax=Culex quinquefasciatus TaxID=7176 RepID=UPI0018E36CFA|nr:uncharacterized protein LOC119766057 isoform X1 [Culex quinquefasciatus]